MHRNTDGKHPLSLTSPRREMSPTAGYQCYSSWGTRRGAYMHTQCSSPCYKHGYTHRTIVRRPHLRQNSHTSQGLYLPAPPPPSRAKNIKKSVLARSHVTRARSATRRVGVCRPGLEWRWRWSAGGHAWKWTPLGRRMALGAGVAGLPQSREQALACI